MNNYNLKYQTLLDRVIVLFMPPNTHIPFSFPEILAKSFFFIELILHIDNVRRKEAKAWRSSRQDP